MTAPVLASRARVLDDPKSRKAVVDGLRRGLSVSSASALIGISREATRLYRKEHPAFHAECIEAVAEYEDGLLKVVNDGAADDAKLALDVLSRRFPSKWSQRSEMRTVEPDDVDEREDDELSDEELEKAAR